VPGRELVNCRQAELAVSCQSRDAPSQRALVRLWCLTRRAAVRQAPRKAQTSTVPPCRLGAVLYWTAWLRPLEVASLYVC
jgi:hypothetical protein